MDSKIGSKLENRKRKECDEKMKLLKNKKKYIEKHEKHGLHVLNFFLTIIKKIVNFFNI